LRAQEPNPFDENSFNTQQIRLDSNAEADNEKASLVGVAGDKSHLDEKNMNKEKGEQA